MKPPTHKPRLIPLDLACALLCDRCSDEEPVMKICEGYWHPDGGGFVACKAETVRQAIAARGPMAAPKTEEAQP